MSAPTGSNASTNRQRALERFAHISASLIAIAALTSLAACGGGGSDPTITPPVLDRPDPPDVPPLEKPPETSPNPDLPQQDASNSLNAPILTIDDNLHIGLDIAPSTDDLEEVTTRSDTAILHGATADGTDADTLIAYLTDDARNNTAPNDDERYIRRFASPPTVRIADNADQHITHLTVRALQIINAALPRDWQLELHPTPGPSANAAHPNPPINEILIQFAAKADWPPGFFNNTPIPGYARTSHTLSTNTLTRASILIDDTLHHSDEAFLDTLVHEILHTLGRKHATAAYNKLTLMRALATFPNVLYTLDRAALQAIYSRLQPGDTVASLAEDLGPWDDTATHLLATVSTHSQDISYGVTMTNGLALPWATGPAPLSNLADNDAIAGSAAWNGHLIGFTPDANPVAGNADLTIALDTLAGDLQFSQLEHWTAGEAPDAARTGTTWSDGTLGYAVSVDGNTFTRTGGDDGILTGAFLGTQHHAMGGTLQRDDLSAAFAGTR